MQTSPATTPEQAPSTLGLPRGHPFHAGPGQRAGGRGEVGGGKSARGHAIGRQGAAGIEAEPADPQHRRAERGVRQVVRRHRLVAEAQSLAEQQRTDQRRNARADVHHRAAGEVERTAGNGITASVPYASIPPPHTQCARGNRRACPTGS